MLKKTGVAKKVDELWVSFLKQQRCLLAEIDINKDDDFKAAIRMIVRTGASQVEIASVLKHSRPTISRWLSEKGPMPRILTRESAYVRLKNYMDGIIDQAAAS